VIESIRPDHRSSLFISSRLIARTPPKVDGAAWSLLVLERIACSGRMDSVSFLVAFPTALTVIRMALIKDEFLAKIADPNACLVDLQWSEDS
jgi:hypothetical protein